MIEIGSGLSTRAKGGVGIYRGNCMHPFLKEGCRIRFEPVPYGEIEIGDIVVLEGNPRRCHRIINSLRYKDRVYFLHKGDRAGEIKLVPREVVLGKVVEIIGGDSRALLPESWKVRNNIFLVRVASFLIFFVFMGLCFLKRIFAGTKKTPFTDALRNAFWKICCLPLRHIM